MRLAGEHELDRAVVVAQQLDHTVDLEQQQAGALVGGEAAGEADRERGRVELGARRGAGDDHVDELAATVGKDVAKFVVVDLVDPRPGRGITVGPRRPEHTIERVLHGVG